MIPKITGIMAATENGVIGINGKLPWNYTDERECFRNITMNHVVVMGRKTYESMPNALFHKRKAIVISRQSDLHLKDATVFHTLEGFLVYAEHCVGQSRIFMIGGGEIAELFLANNLLSSFVFTQIHEPYLGDAFLPVQRLRYFIRKELKKTTHYTTYFLINPGDYIGK